MVLLETLADVKLTPIHYRGGAPLLTDLLGVRCRWAFSVLRSIDQYMKVGTLRTLGVSSPIRLPEFPATFRRSLETVPGYEAVSWFGLFAPKDTPPDIVQQDQRRCANDLCRPRLCAEIPGAELPQCTRRRSRFVFATYIKAEAAKWSGVIKKANLPMIN